MKLQALKRFDYTVDLWDLAYDDQGRPLSETFRESVKLSIDTGDSTTLAMDSLKPIGTGTVMRNVKDRRGTLIYPDNTTSGASYVVTAEQPILSVYSTVEGYTATARRVAAG